MPAEAAVCFLHLMGGKDGLRQGIPRGATIRGMSPLAQSSLRTRARRDESNPASWTDAPCAHVTRLVARILDVPIALLSLPRADEYRFRVNIGLDGYESVPCRISFCAYTMLGTDVLVVPDARIDDRFERNPLVLGAPHIVSYVGVPLISSRGVTLGTLCAIDHKPRAFSATQLDQLRDVARIASWLLESEAVPRDEQLLEATTLLRQLEEQRAAERERLAITLHEGVAQDLFALRLQLQRLRTSSAWRPEGNGEAVAAGAAFTRALDRCIGDVCEIANGLANEGPTQLRIAEAIRLHAQDIAHESGLEIQMHEVGAGKELDSATRLLVLRVAREALANIARHARACHVSIILENTDRELRLRVEDDGVGASTDVLSDAGAPYLASLRERASAAGGALNVGRNVRGGTTLCLQLPTRVAG